ncbi:retroelement silencing factor 1 [Cynocephalus volans]|uniref:retroelement silencing factor 1 n=1 Tax=Cynocephalus volans TaxID=110931 RepID=UPI002FCCB394
MNWNAKPESTTLSPQYPTSQSSFLHLSLMNQLTTTSQNSFSYPGSNQEACMYPGNSNPVSQPLQNVKNYKTPPQIPVSDMHNGTFVASQTSVERITYANVKGPKQLNHNLQMSSGVTQSMWLNPPMRNSMLSHTETTVSHQTDFGTNISNAHGLQSQLVTSDTYSMQVQMIPSNSLRVPITYQGNQGLNQSLSEQQVDWAQHYTSNGLTHPNYRPLPKPYCYTEQSFLQDPTIQKQNLMPSTSSQVKNSQLPNSSLSLQPKQFAAVPSHQYATQTDKRLPPPLPPLPPPYDCRYRRHPLQSTQHVTKHLSMEVPQSQEMHSSEIRKDFCRGFQQQWQNPNENVSTIGNFCNLKVNTSFSQPLNEPVRSSVDGVQALAQNNLEKRMDFCSPTSNQELDTSVTKEKLVRDFKTLIEMKKKFSELARKIKINKELLMAAGCSKIMNTSYSEPAQNSDLSLKQTAKIVSGPQVPPVTPEGQPPTVMKFAEETNKTHSMLNSSIQEINCRKFNQVNPVLLNSVFSEKLPVPDQFNDLKVLTSLKTSVVEDIQATLDKTQLSSENFVHVEQNLPAICETISIPQSASIEECVSKFLNKNLLRSLLTQTDKTQKNLLKDASQTIQDSKPNSCEMNPNTQITGNQLKLKTVETPSSSNANTKISDNSSCLEHKSSVKEMSAKSDSLCSTELLATCLSLWKKQPSETTEEKQCNESRTNGMAVGISKPVEVCVKSPCSVVGNSQNKMVSPSQKPTLSMVVQSCESSGVNITKGTELQVAVVSPLVLSDVKTLSVKGVTPEALHETVYPIIKEGSVCSLQNQLAEDTTAALKVDDNGSVASTTTSKVFPLIQKEKQNASANGNSEGTPLTSKGQHNVSEPDKYFPVSDQATSQSRDSIIMSDGMLQIDNICSLVEGDTSYNSQIAKIFNSLPLKKVEPQIICLPNQQVISSRQQTEQLDNITENKDFGLEKDKFVQCTDVSHKIMDESKTQQPPESSSFKYIETNRGILKESNLEHTTEKESTANDTCCSSAAIQQDIYPQETDACGNYTAQDPTSNEIQNDKTSVFYLHDQLLELLEEFPYGIEAVNMREGAVGQQMAAQISADETGDKSGGDSKESTDQIQITILSSEQMKELFPEQDNQSCDVDKLAGPQKENSVTELENQCDPQAPPEGEGCNSVVLNSEKDDVVYCCALGWLTKVYESVPQCQCNSIKKSTSEEEKGKDQCYPLETNSCTQSERASDRGVPIVECDSLPNNPKTPLTLPDGKNHFHEIQDNIKDTPKTKDDSSLRMEQELTDQFSSKCDKKLDSLQGHKGKKLKFHEVTFHPSNKTAGFYKQAPQESLQKRHIAQNSRPLKAKTVFLTNKDSCKKNGSLVQSVSPEKKLKFKADGSKQKHLEKRKLDQGSILDMEIKKKYEKQEQNKNADGTLKFCNSLSNPSERTRVREKTLSNTKSLDLKESSSKFNRTLTVKEYLQRQKHKEAMGNKEFKKIRVKKVPCDSEYKRSSKLSVQPGNCGKSNERHSSSIQTSKESLNNFTSHGKNFKIHHSEESRTYISRNIQGKVGGRQPDKMCIDKSKLGKKLTSMNNEVEFSQVPSQAKDQKKSYLNRVAFKCTERESICLTKLENSSRRLNEDKEKRQERKSKIVLPVKDTTEEPSMLEFKLCPDALLKNTNSAEELKDLKPHPRKERAPVQVSGIKSTKEDWLKWTKAKKRMREASQEIDNSGSSRLCKRSFSADGFEALQNQVKDSKAMFQTYKQMYLEKRSRSLGSSPVK